MPYRFQKRIARDGQFPDVHRMNDDLLPASENSWNLDEENFEQNCIVAAHLASEAQGRSYYDANAISTGIVDGSYPTVPLAAATATTIPNTGDWAQCDAYIDITTGGALLYVEGNLQYIRHTFQASAPFHSDGGVNNSGVVFGLWIRGVVFPFSSMEDPREMPPIPLRTQSQRGLDGTSSPIATRLPGPNTPIQNPCGACGPELAPVHLVALVTVPAGTHRIQLVGRRVMMKKTESAYAATDYVQVSQEQLYVKEIPLSPAATSTLTGVSVPLFESEDVLSAAALAVDRTNALRTNLNAVEIGQARRGAFNRNHINVATLLNAISVNVGTVGTTFTALTNVYPGYGGSSASWSILTYGGNNVTSGNMAMSTTKCKVKITATVHIKRIISAAGAVGGRLAAVACLAIGETVSGTLSIISASERYLNSFGLSVTNQANEETTVTLIAYRDFSDGSGGTRSWGVYGACADFAAAANASFEPRSGRIDVEIENTFG